MTQHKLLTALAAAVLLVVTVTPAGAQSWGAWGEADGGFAKQGGFVGLSFMPGFTFDGVTFDGESIYRQVNGEEVMILPRLDTRNLVRLTLGYRAKQAGIEISYDRSGHDGVFVGLPGKATFQAINVDGRYFFAPRSRVQPHVLVGGTMPWFTVRDGSFLLDDVADARFKGWGMSGEGGVTVYVHRRVGVGVGYNYRALWFDRATGVSDTLYELKPRFRETSGALVITTHLIF